MSKLCVTVIGGGLAGSEAALQLAQKNINVILYEMRPVKNTVAHETGFLAELLCSNSLKAESLDTASGLLKAELEKMDSILIKIAKKHRVPAGGALAVDREKFAKEIDELIESNPLIKVVREEVVKIPENRPLIIASGPLTSDALSEEIQKLVGKGLHFFDAIAPIIDADSLNFEKCFFKGRYNKGGDDYVNCPMNKDEYDRFYDALMEAEKVNFKDFEKMAVFEGCMPIEEMASRGRQTLSFGPLKPVGLEHPETGEQFYAVVQLRKENAEGTAYNMVGFQTKMKIGEQKIVLRMIPGLENAEFLRYGSVHRNTYINSPEFLDIDFSMKSDEMLFFAGQITGVEGYVESIASGLIVSFHLYRKLMKLDKVDFPKETALNALSKHISVSDKKHFSPSNFHFGMLPPLEGKKIRERKKKKLAYSARALTALEEFIEEYK
jgi:methylenetetrahydrofolate--tRNA-(uracil-5-)-methyltransferase